MICARQSRALSPSSPFELTQSLAALPVGVGVNEVVERFGFGQIELAVLERAPGEFTGLRRPHVPKPRPAPRATRRARPARHEHANSAKVFPCRAGRDRETRGPTASSIGLLTGIPQQRACGHSGYRYLSGERGQDVSGLRSGDPHQRNRARRPGRMRGRRWTGPEGAWPICSGAEEKAAFQTGKKRKINRLAITATHDKSSCCRVPPLQTTSASMPGPEHIQ